MKVLKFLQILATVLVVDFYYYFFHIKGMPDGINTKLMLAVAGLVVLPFVFARRNRPKADNGLIRLTAWALGVSLTSYAAITVNGTSDFTYVTYVVSMYVWLVAAYTVIETIKASHGKCTFPILCNYLVILSVFHCIFALLIDQYAFFANLADAIEGSHAWMKSIKRLYSVGAALDTAGVHFSLVLVLLAYRLINMQEKEGWLIPFYIVAFIIIAVVGSMIARTTYVGVIIGLAFMAYRSIPDFKTYKRLWRWVAVMVACAIPIVTFLYNTNASIHYNIRFGFEGFFNLVENGKWEIGSNKQLRNMIVFPETMKTWIIGDGYMVNPESDPYYTGEITVGYYKNTDIGYLRFIFYSGIIGLLTISAFIICAARNCMHRIPKYSVLFLMVLMVHFCVWLKVSTDSFLIFALLMFLDKQESKEEDNLTPHPFSVRET